MQPPQTRSATKPAHYYDVVAVNTSKINPDSTANNGESFYLQIASNSDFSV
jgi:hypothetical protein